MGFSGFPDEAFMFYEGLEADNSKTYWTRNKPTYDTQVRAPMVELLSALEPEFGPGHIFRPYRDVRFAKNKSPYKDHQGAWAEVELGIGYYVQIAASGVFVAAGFHPHASDQVDRYRTAVDNDRTGTRLVKIVDKLSDAGYQISGEKLKTRPRGFDADHPRLELLRHKSLTAERQWPPEPWVHTPAALDRVRDAWIAMRPLVAWISTEVGPTTAPPSSR
ncbi:MAG: DUF2461 domain-containing protein [Sporichthyaceae bacterium]|nr:DUF2461 domain-containing protein [Sporichthyaceae bacterium]